MLLTASVESPTRSRSMRAWASSRSAGLSQDVVRGVLGSRKKPKMATMAVTAPSLEWMLEDRERGEGVGDLHDKQPAPPCEASETVHACEYAGGDEA
jgi:hypothetical protein